MGEFLRKKGRGAQSQPQNRFISTRREDDFSQLEYDSEWQESESRLKTEFLHDVSKSIISENDSPDVGFRYSLNPYRGCEHGCAYCYARPTHEYLGHSAGLDFESKIYVKHRAPELFREWLARPRWKPETIAFSGVTDCYQPAERRFLLTRQCLQVACEALQPIVIVTKNALVSRDLDILRPMAEANTVCVAISLTTLDESLARQLEPRTSAPSARLRAMQALADSGVPTIAMIAPVIPGLNDSEIPQLLSAAADAGACQARYILLRLPWAVKPIFLDWMQNYSPAHRQRVESLIRSTREGELNNTEFGERMRGNGAVAEQIQRTFQVFRRRYGLDRPAIELDRSRFRPPQQPGGQMTLF